MKNLLAIIVLVMFALSANAQKAEVLYFKANLPCCQATACNNVESAVKSIIDANFGNKVEFKQIKLADASNSVLIQKYNAKTQTVIVLVKKRKEKFIDISDIVRNYTRDNDKEKLEKELVAKINKMLK